jgi:PAS domain S-box-containing protein
VDTITSYDSHNNKRFHKISVFPSKERTGDVYQVVILIRDVTEQMLAAEEVNQIKNFNQRILDTIPVSIISIDRGGFITSVNKYFYNVTAIRDIIGKNIFTLPFYKKNRLVDDYKRLLEQGIPFKKDNLLEINLAGEEKYMNILAVPIKDHGGGIEGAISMAIDNTEANLAHRELEALNNELEQKIIQRTQMLDEVNKKLSRALELKTKFIADTSHELRTPLTIIQGNLDLAAKELASNDKSVPEVLSITNKEVAHMSGILADLTMLSNSDSDSEKISMEKVDLSLIISAVCRSLSILANKKPVKIHCKQSYAPVWIMGDEEKLEKLFLNIIRNAIKYNHPNGWIKVWLKKERNGVNIFIADNGIGIPESDLPFIFERFYRVDKSRSRQEGGSGLGLSICKYIFFFVVLRKK